MPRQHLKQRADGRYACVYHGVFFYGATEREALDAREAYKLRERQGIATDADHTSVRAYAAKWLPVHKHAVSTKTYNDYAHLLNKMLDVIGDMVLPDVRPTDIMRVWMQFDGYSQSTLKRARQLYNSLFDTACDDGYIRTNPMKSNHAKPPKGPEGTHRAINAVERQLIEQSAGHPFYLPAMVMLYAGLRRGEALALDIDRDVDFAEHCIHVREAVRYDSNQPIIDDPKTEAGVRTVPMVSILEDALRGHHGLLSPSRRSGKQMSESSFKSAWKSYIRSIECRINGVKQKRWRDQSKPWLSVTIRPHDLRHSYCTMLRDAGVDIKLAMQWMGHADEKMILKIYDHVTEYRTQQALASLESMLNSQIHSQNKNGATKAP